MLGGLAQRLADTADKPALRRRYAQGVERIAIRLGDRLERDHGGSVPCVVRAVQAARRA